MSKYTRRLGAPIALATVTLLGACRSDAKKGPDSTALGADTTLNRDLALANRDSAAQPQLKDVPANAPAANTPKPSDPRSASTPAPTPSASGSRSRPPATDDDAERQHGDDEPGRRVESRRQRAAAPSERSLTGTTLNTHASSKICTNTNAVGDHVTATVENAVSGSNGAVIPAGATVNLTVTQLKRSENSNDKIVMEFAVNSVTFGGKTYPIEAHRHVGARSIASRTSRRARTRRRSASARWPARSPDGSSARARRRR